MHLFIHIGDHKTGTTSIQAFLRRRAGELAASGIYIPIAGTNSANPGHHNLPFQLIGVKQLNQRDGGLDELLAELRHCRLPRGVISSEEFSHLVVLPEGLKVLESSLREEGHTLSWLMFLRRVDDYSESLYCEMVRSGIPPRHGYPGMALTFLLRGRYRYKFCDYGAFVRQWRSLSASPLHLYDYDLAVSREGLLACFLAAIGAPASLIEASNAPPVLNRRHEQITRHFRRVFRPLLMARFHRSNQRALNS
ncbi:hypothetical protein [Cyanobium gracile]|uniref:Uncharacterized protein n=1 Tax=Cyanobium gracile UHCC 0281 TaxID=3110309 RepID=A0ABU5SX21_9CYAN|nr:hypothetical protein [Cyanobium gracile]MEA5443078.1 hypothetical protein [Cyanobium gracile UHCC 0281]